jgi:hypothetical protein
MKPTGRRYSKEELASRGHAIYDSKIREHVEVGNKGKFVAIDIETGEYEIDADDRAACRRLRNRIPDSQTWLIRVGYRTAYSFAGANASEIPQ